MNSFDEQLDRHVAPPDWTNPTPRGRYHLVVIGGGPAGLVAAAGAAGLGAKVALIEKHRLGGDCLIHGCVPSKALLKSARVAATVREAVRFGVQVPPETRVDFTAVMERMRSLRASLAPHDSAARFTQLGVDIFFGAARFTSPTTVEVGGQSLEFRRAVVTTGACAAIPEIPGLREAGFVTNETIFSLAQLPKRLAVLGAGPAGCELAQAFARFGSQVSLIASRSNILPKEDTDAAAVVEASLRTDGIDVIKNARAVEVSRDGNTKCIHLQVRGGETGQRPIVADELLVAVGRAPNVDGLGLESAGIAFDSRHGIQVDDFLRSTNRRIFAAGDVCSRFQFTHAADAMARIVLQNALFPGRGKASALVIPRCTYTDPEIAAVGLTEAEAHEKGIAVTTLVEKLSDNDRAVLDGEASGFAKVVLRRGSDQILGATVVASHAGDILSEVVLAMTAKIGLRTLARTIHPYPTQAEIIKRLADQCQRSRLTPLVKGCFQRWFAWTR